MKKQTITIREPDATTHLPPQYDELMSLIAGKKELVAMVTTSCRKSSSHAASAAGCARLLEVAVG